MSFWVWVGKKAYEKYKKKKQREEEEREREGEKREEEEALIVKDARTAWSAFDTLEKALSKEARKRADLREILYKKGRELKNLLGVDVHPVFFKDLLNGAFWHQDFLEGEGENVRIREDVLPFLRELARLYKKHKKVPNELPAPLLIWAYKRGLFRDPEFREALEGFLSLRRDYHHIFAPILLAKPVEEILKDPDVLEQVAEFLERLGRLKSGPAALQPVIIDLGIPSGMMDKPVRLVLDPRKEPDDILYVLNLISSGLEMPLGARKLSTEEIKKIARFLRVFAKKIREVQERERGVPAGAAVEAVQLPPPPRMITAIERKLAKIEAAQDFLGGIPLEYVKALHRELEKRSDLLRKALLHLETHWTRGDFRPVEGLEHLKGLPEEKLQEHELAGDLEYYRQKLERGELTVDDVRSILHTLHSTYTLSAKLLEDFLKRPEEEIMLRWGEPATGRVKIKEREVETPLLRPEVFKEHVSEPMRKVLESAKPIVLHKP